MFSNRFRWVFCQLEVLRICFPANLRRTLEELPKSLDETYKRILKEINNVNGDQAFRLLQCLSVASRPLRVEELAELLAFDFTEGTPKWNADWRWEDQEAAVLSACSSLVSVVSNDGSRVVQFAHFSVKEFLTSDRLANSTEEVSGFHLPLEPAHTTLAQACLSVLLRLESDTKTYTPLVRYAAEYWVTHARFEKVESHLKDAMDCFFDTDKPHFSAWVQIHDIQANDADGIWSLWMAHAHSRATITPLYCAALCGFRDQVERLIAKYPGHVSARAGRYGTPLHATLFGEGHIDVAKLLTERGSDVNALNGAKWTPLHFVSLFGHLDVAKWLLAHGASVNSKNDDGWTPLHLAAYHGSIQIARMLLEHKARLNVRDNHGRTPLHRALGLEHPKSEQSEIVRLLLDHSADMQVGDNSGTTPLHLAARNGPFEAVRELLRLNAEVNSRNHHGSTPLLLASRFGQVDTVQLLLDHNADIYARDDHGDTPLHCAALGGQLEVAQRLLKLNVEVNSRNDRGSTPLHLASKGLPEGNPDIVRLFLDHGADVYVRDADGNTPLHCAALGGQLEVVQMLLELNVEVNSRNDEGKTPLQLTSEDRRWVGYQDAFQILLRRPRDHGAGADAPPELDLSEIGDSDYDSDYDSEVLVARAQRWGEIKRLLSQYAGDERTVTDE